MNRTSQDGQPSVELPSRDKSPRFQEMILVDPGNINRAATAENYRVIIPSMGRILRGEKQQIAAERFRKTAAATLVQEIPDSSCLVSELMTLAKTLPFDTLMALTMNPFAGRRISFLRDIKFPDPVTDAFLKMFRVVEGQTTNPAPRMSPPYLQRLRSGATRTILDTTIPRLMGEWLEAADVQEYLEEQGIIIGSDKTVKAIQLITSTQLVSISAPTIPANIQDGANQARSAIGIPYTNSAFDTFQGAIRGQT